MSAAREILTLYAVTDRRWCSDQNLKEQVEAAIKGGVTTVQLREK
ncbi:MAG: thiamine phosphate synthase, partial [Eggerthellaceae bacterium]|nr:thiamine phosphate synthase [Eggerthellaceae bacterium]